MAAHGGATVGWARRGTAGAALLVVALIAPARGGAQPDDGPLPAGAGPLTLPLDPVAAAPGPAERAAAAPATLTVFTYRPPGFRDGPLIVVLHGSSRDADVYRDRARVLGDRFGALIVAPRFDRRHFPAPRYPGGVGALRDPAGAPVFRLLERLVATVRRREGRPTLPCYFIGHSAGGRAVLLLAAFSHLDAVRFVAANPSAPLWPTRGVRFPRGLGGLPAPLGGDEARRRYLGRPLTLYLGTADHTQDGQAAKHFAAARAEAALHGWAFGWTLVPAPHVGHRSAEMFRRPEVGEALLGRPAP